MTNELKNARYVNDDLLAQTFLFRSKRGQRFFGLRNGRIIHQVDFADDHLNLRVTPAHIESLREIAYSDIAKVSVKRYMNTAYIIAIILCLCVSPITSGLSLFLVALEIWSGLGNKIEIQLNNGSVVQFFSSNSMAYSQNFVSLLTTTITRVKENNCILPQDSNEDITSSLFIQRDMNMKSFCQESWDHMITLLQSDQSFDQLADQLVTSINPNCENPASAQVHNSLFQKGVQKAAGHLLSNEIPLFYIDNALAFRTKKFTLLTNQRILFYVNEQVYSIPFGKVYKFSHYRNAGWTVNGFASSFLSSEAFVKGVLSSWQIGCILALICLGAIEQNGISHKIVVDQVFDL